MVRLGRKANDRSRTIGSAFSGCTFPGTESPLFCLPDGHMGLGLGTELARRLAKEWIGYTFDPASASAGQVKVLTDFEGC